MTMSIAVVVTLIAGLLVVVSPPATAAPMCFGREATHVGTPESDTISGTSGNDVIVGMGDRDFIRGRGGNDRICGGGHNDLLLGDEISCKGVPGRDRLSGGNGQDVMYGDGCRAGEGPGKRDVLRGGPSGDAMSGGPGDDYLDGEEGGDAFLLESVGSTRVDLARDRVGGSEGSDRLRSFQHVFARECRSAGDVIIGNKENNKISASEGPDVIQSRGGNDRVWSDGKTSDAVNANPCPGGGNDRVRAGSGDDLIVATEGDDYLNGGPGKDAGKAGPGFDECVALERRRRCET